MTGLFLADDCVNWGEGSAHVFSAENVNGNIVFVDPQAGKLNVSNYFSKQKSDLIGIARVDKLKIKLAFPNLCTTLDSIGVL